MTVRYFSRVDAFYWLKTATMIVLEISIPYLPFQLWLFNADTAVITNVESLKAVVKTGIYSVGNKGINCLLSKQL